MNQSILYLIARKDTQCTKINASNTRAFNTLDLRKACEMHIFSNQQFGVSYFTALFVRNLYNFKQIKFEISYFLTQLLLFEITLKKTYEYKYICECIMPNNSSL